MAHPPVPHIYSKAAVGRRVRLIRAAHDNMAQNAFAEMIGTRNNNLANWEAGSHYVPIETAFQICAKTGASFDYIFRGLEGELSPTLRANLRKAEKIVQAEEAKKAQSRLQRPEEATETV